MGFASMPNRPHRMDYPFGGQFETWRDTCVPRRTATDSTTFFQQFGAGGAMNGTIDTPAAQQGFICRVDDGVYLQRRDIGLDNPNHKLFDNPEFRALARRFTIRMRAIRAWIMIAIKRIFRKRKTLAVFLCINRQHGGVGNFYLMTLGAETR